MIDMDHRAARPATGSHAHSLIPRADLDLDVLGDGLADTDTVTAQGPQTLTGHARSGDF
jgi:hypothetical protein